MDLINLHMFLQLFDCADAHEVYKVCPNGSCEVDESSITVKLVNDSFLNEPFEQHFRLDFPCTARQLFAFAHQIDEWQEDCVETGHKHSVVNSLPKVFVDKWQADYERLSEWRFNSGLMTTAIKERISDAAFVVNWSHYKTLSTWTRQQALYLVLSIEPPEFYKIEKHADYQSMCRPLLELQEQIRDKLPNSSYPPEIWLTWFKEQGYLDSAPEPLHELREMLFVYRFPVCDAAAKKVVERDETLNNGKPIDWEYWNQLKNITPIQAAKLTHNIDPVLWPSDRYAAGKECIEKYEGEKIDNELRVKIQRLELRLSNTSLSWDLVSLVKFLDVENAPFGMQQAISELAETTMESSCVSHETEREIIGSDSAGIQPIMQPKSTMNINANRNEIEFSELLIIPRKIDDWFRVIDDMVKAYFEQYAEKPNGTQAWGQLSKKPPLGYEITTTRDKGGRR